LLLLLYFLFILLLDNLILELFFPIDSLLDLFKKTQRLTIVSVGGGCCGGLSLWLLLELLLGNLLWLWLLLLSWLLSKRILWLL